MTADNSWVVVLQIIASLGGGGLIVAGLSSWLGKVWADRLMARERADHETLLAQLRANLEHQNQVQIEALRTELRVTEEKHLKGFQDRVAIYRMAVDIVADFLGDLDRYLQAGQAIPEERYDMFNRMRMKAYGYLAMLASQRVMDAYDQLADHLLQIVGGQQSYEWDEVRRLALGLLNAVRVDIGLDPSPIQYNGRL